MKMPTIQILDDEENEIMTIVYQKDSTVLEAMDALVSLRKKEFTTNGTTSAGFRETGA